MELKWKLAASVSVLVLSFFICGVGAGELFEGYYSESCPLAEEIVRHHVKAELLRDPSMAAALLRLQFHDCFVQGCDGSVMLDNTPILLSEKEAVPNKRSVRGFELIDRIKFSLEEACPQTVSCADTLVMISRDSVHLRGGPYWTVELGRKDSLTASFSGANQLIPAPNSTMETLIRKFADQGLDKRDLVVLSGAHTIGRSRCVSFRQWIYEHSYDYPRYAVNDYVYRQILRSICPVSGGDDIRTSLDLRTAASFDNQYFINLLSGKGLLASDRKLVSQDADDEIAYWVWAYAYDQQLFFRHFVESMLRMTRVNPLTASEGEIREYCRYTNSYFGQNAELRQAVKARRVQEVNEEN
ncbi:peroxidase 20 [Nymphaea colorata]|nr:peroxidase 20 [Nymphaea colorata]